MTTLLVARQYIKTFISKYEVYLKPLFKMILALISLMMINGKIGYMHRLDNISIVLIIALMCSFMPMNFIIFVAAAFIVLHLYALSLECAAIARIIFLVMFLLMSVFLGRASLDVRAQEDSGDFSVTELNQVMTIAQDCSVYESPSEDSAVVRDYTAGSSVWVTGETQNGWYRISYQESEGYILKDSTTGLMIEVEGKGIVDLEDAGLAEEMAALEAENKAFIENVERQRAELKRSRIWMVVIVVLIVAIFAVGIVSTIKQVKKEEGQGDSGTKKKQKDREIEMIDLDSEEE